MAPLLLGVGFLQFDEVSLADVSGVGVAQVAAEEIEREGVTLHVLDELLELIQQRASIGARDGFPQTALHPEGLE